MRTISVDVEVDLADFSDSEIFEEADSRRDSAYIGELLDRPAVLSWLRGSNPPQDVRDWFYEFKGQIL